jgi:uncharacterized protein (TIGR02996 family)
MTDESDFIKAICFNPDEDWPRLTYADWLDDHGQHERAGFIRTQVDSKVPLTAHCIYGAAVVTLNNVWPHDSERQWKNLGAWFGHMIGKISKVVIHRGFITEVTLPMGVFVGEDCRLCNGGPYSYQCHACHGTGNIPGIAKEVFERWPITRVTLTGIPDGRYIPETIYTSIGITAYRIVSEVTLGVLTREEASSVACVEYGRRLAGLPSLFDVTYTGRPSAKAAS